ncbi:MAG: histidine--tRNA ligase [Gammaproteobacteria bacterium]|nr:histidine--tRNA ligase [Gammaproteobacteria bacterium]
MRVRGMRDVLPGEARRWRQIETAIVDVLDRFAYQEVQLPMLEAVELFSRGVGEATDIVEKEMYCLTDRDGEVIALRPEGTAGCARALDENGLLYNQTQRVFYRGPMFRYERPQKGRYRQFYQVGVEAFGLSGPDIDAELIQLGCELWRTLGIDGEVRLELNSIGSSGARAAFREALVGWLEPRKESLDEDSRRRLTTNPLRILDSKSEETRRALDNGPAFEDYLDEASAEHYAGLKAMLDELGLDYVENPRLVRGLDYYTRSVFEWTTERLGAQGAICAGGRYDGLVELLGGKATPAAGFAIGVERVLLLHEVVHGASPEVPADVYCCVLQPGLHGAALAAVQRLRCMAPELRVRVHAGGGKLKNQLKRADRSGARWALLFGEAEVEEGLVALKDLRGDAGQEQLHLEDVAARLNGWRTAKE